MKFRFLMCFAFLMGGAATAKAQGHLTASLIQADTGKPTKLTLILTNEGDSPMAFEEYTTPLVLLDDIHTSYKQFDVEAVDAPHEQAAYRGYFVHTLGHPEDKYVTFQPGESRVATYDLRPDYELEPGKSYKVTFRMTVGQAPEDRQGLAIPTKLRIPPRLEVVSNTIVVTASTVEGKAEGKASTKAITDPAKLDKLDYATYYGYSWMANSAWVEYSHGLPPFPDPDAVSIHSPAYKKWFGTYADGDENDKKVTGTLRAIAHRLNQGIHGTPSHKIRWVEDCPPGSDDTVAIAHTGSVKESGVYEIAICPAFWSLPAKPTESNRTADTQAAVMVHEISHFADLPSDQLGWTGLTFDWTGYAYSRSACERLVHDDRAKAVMSASNFEYFIQDVQKSFLGRGLQ